MFEHANVQMYDCTVTGHGGVSNIYHNSTHNQDSFNTTTTTTKDSYNDSSRSFDPQAEYSYNDTENPGQYTSTADGTSSDESYEQNDQSHTGNAPGPNEQYFTRYHSTMREETREGAFTRSGNERRRNPASSAPFGEVPGSYNRQPSRVSPTQQFRPNPRQPSGIYGGSGTFPQSNAHFQRRQTYPSFTSTSSDPPPFGSNNPYRTLVDQPSAYTQAPDEEPSGSSNPLPPQP